MTVVYPKLFVKIQLMRTSRAFLLHLNTIIIKCLLVSLSQGGVLNAATSHDGRTPLHVACLEGQLRVIRHLLAKGASPHVIDNHGQTPLHDAIRSANEEAILLLREFGAHLGPTTTDTALVMCSLAADDKVDVLRAWHLAGVDLNVGDYDRRTALHVVRKAILLGETKRYHTPMITVTKIKSLI